MPQAWWAANLWGASTRDQLTQEQCDEEEGGAEGRAGEAAECEEEEDDVDDDSEEGYVSPEDPFPHEARKRLTEEDLDKDFDPKKEVGI